MDVTKLTDAELQAELHRRQEEREAHAELDRQARFRLLVKHRDVLLEFVEHERTSCSDQDPNNGLGSSQYGARCARCALLRLDEFDCLNYEANLGLEFRSRD